jgi:hypothetical protein
MARSPHLLLATALRKARQSVTGQRQQHCEQDEETGSTLPPMVATKIWGGSMPVSTTPSHGYKMPSGSTPIPEPALNDEARFLTPASHAQGGPTRH